MFQYDHAGNLLVDDKARYSYDAFNRTEKVETFDGHIQLNRYDAEGLRYEMEENGNLVRFIFNQDREAVAEEDTSGLNRLIRGTELIATNSSADSARTYYHYASDEMGSTTHIVDETGAVQNRYEYDAWGSITAQEEAVPNRFKFTGQQLDPITQQYYLRARFYNPVIARFTQEDTYRGDGLNLYAYCANNPILYIDPTGYNPRCVKEAAAEYMKLGMSQEDAYRRAYAEHANRRLADPNISAREKAEIESRLQRVDYPHKPRADTPDGTSSHHVMEGSVYRNGEAIPDLGGAYESGGGAGGYQAGLQSHTERKFLKDVQDSGLTQTGDLLYMNGEKNPCRPGCQPQMRNEVKESGTNIIYTASDTGLTYTFTPYTDTKLKGEVQQQVTNNKGEVVENWRYWQVNGRWRRASIL